MAQSYFDSKGAFSDPASNTNLKYLRQDATWNVADTNHKFLNKSAAWTVPELGPTQDDFKNMSWAEVAALSAEAAANPSAYKRMLGWTRNFSITTSNGSNSWTTDVEVVLVDIGYPMSGFTFFWHTGTLPYFEPSSYSPTDPPAYEDSNADGLCEDDWYASRIPADLRAVIKETAFKTYNYCPNDDDSSLPADETELVSTTTCKGHLWIPAYVELFGSTPSMYNGSVEGQQFAYLASLTPSVGLPNFLAMGTSYYTRTPYGMKMGGPIIPTFYEVSARGGVGSMAIDHYCMPCFCV